MATDTYRRCAICRCYLDDEDLFCANCGTENPHFDREALAPVWEDEKYSFDCKGCGASMSYDASAQALRCPFCGGTAMTSVAARRMLHCDWVVPLKVSYEQAEAILRSWLGQGFWRPSDAARVATIGEIAAVYVPFWVFEAESDTKWTADSTPAPLGCRGDWHPVSGAFRSSHQDILIAGSSILAWQEVSAILPYHVQSATGHDQVDLENAIVETLKVPRKAARPLARAAIEERERKACIDYIPGKPRRVKVNVRIHGMLGRPMLLPVWIMAYRYREKIHRVLINGQTGKIAGSAPFSYHKLSMVVGIFLGIVLAIIAVIVLLALLTGR